MTDPTNPEQDPDTKPAADPEPQVEVEMIKDLDVPDDDNAGLLGGCSWTRRSV
jgi:hypothetical protein